MNRVLVDNVLPLFDKLYYKYPDIYLPLYFVYKKIAETNRTSFIKSWLREGDTALDVGANVGFYTKLFSHLVGDAGEVYAFEPDITNFKMLNKVCTSCSNVFLNRKAVSNKNETLSIYRSTERNTDHQTFDIGEGRSFKKVPAIALDKYFDNKKQISLIKLEIQGYDYYALSGMKSIIKRSKRLALIGEMWPYALTKLGVNPMDYVKLIKKLGLSIKNNGIDTRELLKQVNNRYYYVDFIAIKT